ncbi:MAG: hypothetical protein JXJ04_24185 [Spirochaetales bacterium]|nr:hypothetical protein [Spirochaetales bacterium]
MKNKLFIVFSTIIVLLFCFSCVSNKIEEDIPNAPHLLGSSSGPDDMSGNSKKAGGLEEIPIDSQKAVQGYDFLKESLALSHPLIELQKLLKAYSQVVAGYNIVLICTYGESESETDKYLYAKIYYGLDETPKVISLILDYESEEKTPEQEKPPEQGALE